MCLLAIMETDVHAIRIEPTRGGFAAMRPWGVGGWEGAGGVGDGARTLHKQLTRGVFGNVWAAHSLGLKPAWSTAKGRP